MFRINTPGATEEGRFKESPAPATKVGAGWLNALQDEVVHVIEHEDGGDAALDPEDSGQLLDAILAMVARGAGASYVEGTYETTVSFGVIRVKIGVAAGFYGEQLLPVAFETPFPDRCWGVIPVVRNTTGNLFRDVNAQLVSRTKDGFTVGLNFSGGSSGTATNDGVEYVAIGR